MSKKKWLLLIIVVAVLGYLILSKVSPSWSAGIDNLLGPAVSGLATGIYTAVNQSPIWQQWDVWFGVAFGGLIIALVMWQGHNAFNKIRGSAITSAHKELGYQTVPTATPTVIASPTPTATPTKPAPVLVAEEAEKS